MPTEEATINLTLRLPTHLHGKSVILATRHRRSLNAQLVTSVENEIIRAHFDDKAAAKKERKAKP